MLTTAPTRYFLYYVTKRIDILMSLGVDTCLKREITGMISITGSQRHLFVRTRVKQEGKNRIRRELRVPDVRLKIVGHTKIDKYIVGRRRRAGWMRVCVASGGYSVIGESLYPNHYLLKGQCNATSVDSLRPRGSWGGICSPCSSESFSAITHSSRYVCVDPVFLLFTYHFFLSFSLIC